VNKGDALPGPERQCVSVILGVGGGRVRSIAHNWPTRFSHLDLHLDGDYAALDSINNGNGRQFAGAC
jgi:hypothetical protein